MSILHRLSHYAGSVAQQIIHGDRSYGLFGYDELAEQVPYNSFDDPADRWDAEDASAQRGAEPPAPGSHATNTAAWRLGNPGAGTQNSTNRQRLVGTSDPKHPVNACPAAQVGNHGSDTPAAGVQTTTDGLVAFAPVAGTKTTAGDELRAHTSAMPVGSGQSIPPTHPSCPDPAPLDEARVRQIAQDELADICEQIVIALRESK